VKTETRSYTDIFSSRIRFPTVALVDLLGLALVMCLLVFYLSTTDSVTQAFSVNLAASALIAWLFLAQFRSIATILTRQSYRLLLAPSLAALTTLCIQALTRSYYSGTALSYFVVGWTLWMLLVRLAYGRYHPPLRALVIGAPSFYTELRSLPQLVVTRLDTPPSSFRDLDVVVLDPVRVYDDEWLQWLSHADMMGLKIVAAPLVLETLTCRVPLEMLHGRWAYAVFSGQSNYAPLKRVLDLAVVLVVSPLLLLLASLVALVVYVDSGGPVLFWQKRVGKDGVPFMMVKFRSMRSDAERNGAAFATVGDARVTRIGAFLRKFRLDELPQFWNVVRGEMSIIGPRPEQDGFAKQFEGEIPLYSLRHNVLPGITGWAQVRNGYAAGADETVEKLRYDFYYVKHFSLELDMQVVVKTVATMLTGFGAR
jgi:lipopolysaccharide/colanic/teichoic acid biosynthesis glycosyltransferase